MTSLRSNGGGKTPPEGTISRTSSLESKTLPKEPSFIATSQEVLDDIYRFQCDTWAFEVLSLFMSLVALVSAGTALWFYDGKPYPKWPYSLTLNALISVCMTVMVASLTVPVSAGLGQLKWILARRKGINVMQMDTLDRASRGIWGSLCALFTFTGGLLGALGSIVMIVAFAAAPFGQQAIFSSIGAFESLQDPLTAITACTSSDALQEICPVRTLKGDLQKGKNQGASILRRGYYSSIYSTFNASVVADNIAICPTGNCTWPAFPTLSLCNECKNITEALLVNETQGTDAIGQLASVPDGPFLDTSFGAFALGLTSASSRFPTNNATIQTFAALEASGDGSISAIECGLSLCVQVIEATILDGALRETIVQEFKEGIPEGEIISSGSAEVKEFDPRLVFPPPTNATGTVFTTAISVDLSDFKCFSDILDFDRRENIPLAEMGLEKIPAAIDNMAIAVGRSFRNICVNNTQHRGSSWDRVTLVRVNWYWFILPVVVEVLGACFFVTLLLFNRPSGTSLWKSSLVAAFFHGFDMELWHHRTSLEEMYNMELVAEDTTVKLSTLSGERGSRSKLVRIP